MVFHVRWIFLTTSLWIPPESLAAKVGFWDKWWEINLTWKTIQNAFSRILYTLRHLNEVAYTAKLQIMKTMWNGCISQLFSAWGKVRSMRECLRAGRRCEHAGRHLVAKIYMGSYRVSKKGVRKILHDIVLHNVLIMKCNYLLFT